MAGEGPGSPALSAPEDTAGENIPMVDADPGACAPDGSSFIFLQNLIVDISNLLASLKSISRFIMLWLVTLYPLFTLQMASDNGFQNFAIFLELETGSTLLFLTVWETGYAEAHVGPFTREDLDRFYSAVFASRSSDPPKVFLGRR